MCSTGKSQLGLHLRTLLYGDIGSNGKPTIMKKISKITKSEMNNIMNVDRRIIFLDPPPVSFSKADLVELIDNHYERVPRLVF